MGRDGVVRGGGVSAAFGEDHAGACGVHAPEAEADEFLVFGACFGEIALAFGVGFLKQKMHSKQARATRAKTAPAAQERKVSNG